MDPRKLDMIDYALGKSVEAGALSTGATKSMLDLLMTMGRGTLNPHVPLLEICVNVSLL